MPPGFSFEVVDAADYDELRPGYAWEAIDWVAQRADLRPSSLVIDLAAGTGQLAGRFAARGYQVVAIEPAANMRRVFANRRPSVPVREGTAEAMPIDDGTGAAVVVGNAFHHFDRLNAFREIHRVLRPGGALALFWAWPLEEEHLIRYPGLRQIDDVVRATRVSNEIATAYQVWKEIPEREVGFGMFERREFAFLHVLASDRLPDLYATSSDVASLPAPVRTAMLDRVRELSRELPDVLRLPTRSVVDVCIRDEETADPSAAGLR